MASMSSGVSLEKKYCVFFDDMDPKRFRAKLAWCDATSRANSVQSARKRCHDLLKNTLSSSQQSKVLRKLSSMQEAMQECTTLVTTAPLSLVRLSQSSITVALGHESFYELRQNQLVCNYSEFDIIRDFMKNKVKATPNPRNPKTFLKRKQCTFVENNASEYHFGQYNQTFRQDHSEWPKVIQEALRLAKHHATRFNIDPDLYNGVHVNLYDDGSVGVKPHYDKEVSMLAGAPIFSFTLLSDPTLPRLFSIYDLHSTKLQDIVLEHGDMMVMFGKMQTHFKHGVEAAKPPQKYKHLSRINITVRAFKVFTE